MTLLKLDEYTKMATSFIMSIGSQWLTDENIGIAVRHLINSDKTFDNTKGASITTYRYGALINAKYEIFRNKTHHWSLNSDICGDVKYSSVTSSIRSPLEILEEVEDLQKKQQLIEGIVNNPELTPTEKKYIRMIYVDGISRGEIAKQCNVTKQAVSYTEQKALDKLRSLYV